MARLIKAQSPKKCLFPSLLEHSEAAVANTSATLH